MSLFPLSRRSAFAPFALLTLLVPALAATLPVAGAHAAEATAPQRARQLMDGGHWKQARALLEPEYRARPEDHAVLSALAEVRMRFGDAEAAEKLAEQAVKLAPGDAQAQESLSEVLGERASNAGMLKAMGYAKRFRKAAEAALSLDPQRIDPRFSLIVFHLKAPGIAGGDRKKARAYVDEIARLDPARGELAQARFEEESGDTTQLESHYRKAVEKDPASLQARMALANWASAPWRAQWPLAEEQARAVMHAAPDRSGPYALLAAIDAHLERWADLETMLAAADAATPDNRSAWYQAGRVLLTDGHDLPRAEGCFRHFLEIEPEPGGPGLAHARWRLAQVLEKENRRSEAVIELQTALRLKPDLEPAKKDLKRLKG